MMMFGVSRLRLAARMVVLGRNFNHALRPVRQSSEGWVYRQIDLDRPKSHKFLSEGIMAVMWYWVLWHFWYDFEHIAGHHKYPDPSKWTDAELGIPPLEDE